MDARLETLDLNLLLGLHWLLSERQVTAAADRLSISQPAASRMLGRLRDFFDDPLLVKVGGEMVPTPLGESLQPALAHAIDACRDVLRVSSEFDPAKEEGTYRLAALDYIGAMAGMVWEAMIHPHAPNLTLDIIRPTVDCARDLVTGKVDLCFIPDVEELDLPPSIDVDAYVKKSVFQHERAMAIRASHPLAGKIDDIETYLSLDHISINPEPENPGVIDACLAQMGYQRRIRYKVDQFLLSLPLVQNTDCILTAPRVLLEAKPDGLVISPVPFELPTWNMNVVWHPNWTGHPRHRWVRTQLIEAMGRTDCCPYEHALNTIAARAVS